MYMEDLKELAILIFSSGAFFALLQFLIQRHDNKKGIEKQLSSKLSELDVKIDNKLNEVNQNVNAKFTDLNEKVDQNQAVLARTHILRFADDLKNGVTHSDEYFEQQLDDIKTYNLYCQTHPTFKNERTVLSSEFIIRRYNEEQFGKQVGEHVS